MRRRGPKRDFLSVADLTADEVAQVIALTHAFAQGIAPREARASTAGKTLAIVLEKPSTRTRVSLEVAAAELDMHRVVLPLDSAQHARGEPLRDTARALARYCDAIAFRTTTTAHLLEMARAEVPVINALSNEAHPMQALADVAAMEALLGRPARELRVAFVGDAGCNVARSLLEIARLVGFRLALGAPAAPALRPPPDEFAAAGTYASLHESARAAVQGADVVYTDVWTSMGFEEERAARTAALSAFRVDERLLAHAPPHAIVMHCLPAHRGEEIEESVIEGARSRVWDQAEFRLHSAKALLSFLLGGAEHPAP